MFRFGPWLRCLWSWLQVEVGGCLLGGGVLVWFVCVWPADRTVFVVVYRGLFGATSFEPDSR